jgi:hypothetical protein
VQLQHCRKPQVDRGVSQVRASAIGFALILADTGTVFASGYGIGTYRPGLMDLFAGYLVPPGATIVKDYFLFQEARADATTADGHLQANNHTLTYTEATFAAHVTRWKVLGSYYAFGLIAQTRLADQSLRVLGLGPLAGATVKLWDVPVSFSLKYDFEFAARNRSTGNELWLTAALPL